MIFTSTLIWYQTHRPKTNTQIYINPTCYVRTTYTQWIICRYKNLLYRGSQCLCFSKVTRLWKSYICWLHSTRRSPSSETTNTDWNGINEQNVHTTHTDKDNLRFRKGWLVWACNNPFFRTPSYGTILNPLPFFGKFRKLHPPLPRPLYLKSYSCFESPRNYWHFIELCDVRFCLSMKYTIYSSGIC